MNILKLFIIPYTGTPYTIIGSLTYSDYSFSA